MFAASPQKLLSMKALGASHVCGFAAKAAQLIIQVPALARRAKLLDAYRAK
jgi:hypothetical protein